MGLLEKLKSSVKDVYDHVDAAMDGAGTYGEFLTDRKLNKGDIPGKFFTLKNVYVPVRGRTTEIDVIMVHEKGIFVFESKNYSGWIFGSTEQQQWTQVLKGGAKERFYSPIKQNKSHIKALSGHLGLPEDLFVSFIVFSERCELKKVPEDTSDCIILRRHHLVHEVKRALEYRPVVFDEARMSYLVDEMASLGKTEEKASAHIKTVEKIKNSEICPWCGAELVRRNGKNGPFMGCSSFPKCRYTARVK
ncbi:MAG: NERD domain-containing protein [Eggerthellaceae bacterium]|nr:NERD domain-containing protein [Eggerthellaceae bacterium]